MKKRNETYHYQPETIPGPGYHPLTDHELAELRDAFRTTRDYYIAASIARRIAQGVEGMTVPGPISGPVADAAADAWKLFVAWCISGEEISHRRLLTHLGIQPELPIAA